MTKSEILDLALSLDFKDRKELSLAIGASLRRDASAILTVENGKRYLDLMEEMLGMPLNTKPYRPPRLVAARMIVGYAMMLRGFPHVTISKVLQRDHSTISYWVKKVDAYAAFPEQYSVENGIYRDYFNELQKRNM